MQVSKINMLVYCFSCGYWIKIENEHKIYFLLAWSNREVSALIVRNICVGNLQTMTGIVNQSCKIFTLLNCTIYDWEEAISSMYIYLAFNWIWVQNIIVIIVKNIGCLIFKEELTFSLTNTKKSFWRSLFKIEDVQWLMLNLKWLASREKHLGVVTGICDVDTEIILLNSYIHYV